MISPADTAWMLTSTALVLLMTPALAFFYGGLVGAKNVLNTMMMSIIALGFVGVLWAVIGYSLAFAYRRTGSATRRTCSCAASASRPRAAFPTCCSCPTRATFAIITAALISGAVVGRMRFSAYVAFISLWALVVYSPIAHWVWGGGWLAKMGALDFAGGTVVHVNAGTAALVTAMVVGPRRGLSERAHAAAQRAVHDSRRRPAVVRMVRLQFRQRARGKPERRARVHDHAARPDRDARRLDAARCGADAEADGGGCRDSDCRRAGGHHAGCRLHRPDERAHPRRPGGHSQLLRPAVARQDVTRRLAGRRRGSRRRRHGRRAADRRLRAKGDERHQPTACSSATPRSWASRPWRSLPRSSTAAS